MITKAFLKSKIDELNDADLDEVYKFLLSINQPVTKSNGVKMAAILQLMADRRALAQIQNPIEWQRLLRLEKNHQNIG
jgi:hypothetical protein